MREVAARTEQYGCPIQHGRRVRQPHHRHAAIARDGDPAGYRAALASLRAALKK